MKILRRIREKLDGLDKKLFSSTKAKKVADISILAGLGIGITTSAFEYFHWRNEHIYHEKHNVVAPRCFVTNPANEANRLLLNFPAKIPGAAKVDRYITPEAKYCLVHIRQVHLVEKTSAELKEEVGIVQGDIYQTLTFLIKNYNLKEIYTEAVSKETQNLDNNLIKLNADLSELLDEAGSSIETSIREEISTLEKKIESIQQKKAIPWEAFDKYPNDPNGTEKYLSDLRQQLEQNKVHLLLEMQRSIGRRKENSERYKYDAVSRVVEEYGVKIVAAEDFRLNLLASVLNKDDTNFRQVVLEDRENTLLQIIAQQDSPLAISIYGGAHAWGGYRSFGFSYLLTNGRVSIEDNIVEWNRKHPDKKFSLIEITPEHYNQN